jgi:hypothetical protein
LQGPTGPAGGPTGPTGPAGQFSFFGAEVPPTGQAGQSWFNTSNGKIYVYYDGYWIESASSNIGVQGTDGTFISTDNKTVTVVNGIITSII